MASMLQRVLACGVPQVKVQHLDSEQVLVRRPRLPALSGCLWEAGGQDQLQEGVNVSLCISLDLWGNWINCWIHSLCTFSARAAWQTGYYMGFEVRVGVRGRPLESVTLGKLPNLSMPLCLYL